MHEYDEIRRLLMDYAEEASELEAREANMKEIKAQIIKLMPESKVAIDGLATVQQISSSTTVSYDAKAVKSVMLEALKRNDKSTVMGLIASISTFDGDSIDGLVTKSVDDGDMETAKSLSGLRKESKRSGSLRIAFVK